jgi:hypothetical protein
MYSQLFRFTAIARLVTLVFVALFSGITSSVVAQDKTRGLTLEEYKKVKSFGIGDLETETYVKFENAFVLDRYEMRPPYVFKYSDGIERKIYLYRLLDNKTKASLGMVVVYFTPGDNKKINVCIPNPQADKAVWVQYIDDLKEYNQLEKGFGSAFSYVTSREMAALAGGGAGTTASTGSKTDFDVCFPAFAVVTMADGRLLPISQVKAGDKVASYNTETRTCETATVQEVEVHDQQLYGITTVFLSRVELFASLSSDQRGHSHILEATPNHPVWTQNGRKPVGNLALGEVLTGRNSDGTFAQWQVMGMSNQAAGGAAYFTDKVYNLVTSKPAYLVNQMVVYTK